MLVGRAALGRGARRRLLPRRLLVGLPLRRRSGSRPRSRSWRVPLRWKHDHGRAPVWKAVAPKQVGWLQMAELDELRQLRLAQRPVLLAVTCEIPLNL
jgi:hypothetical protein